MTDDDMDVVPGARAPVLAAALLARIQELNRDYVEIMLAERSLPSSGIATEALPHKCLDALAGLSSRARAALTECPFALFSLGFDDRRFWSLILGDGNEAQASLKNDSVQVRYGAMSSAPMQTAFAEVALFTAWHTAQSNRIAARFLFGISDEIAALLARAPLWHIRRIAIDYHGLVTPRWPTNPAFWPDLIRFATAGDAARLETARLLGGQLNAAEIDGSLSRVASSRARRVRRKLSG